MNSESGYTLPADIRMFDSLLPFRSPGLILAPKYHPNALELFRHRAAVLTSFVRL